MKIAIDAGHGFHTPGKRSPNGMKEFEFNVAVAIEAKKLLLGYESVEVLFTHDITGAVDVPLRERCRRANDWKADLLISIHANAFGFNWNAAEGIETFVYTTKPKESYDLAIQVQNQLLRHTGRNNRGVKTADFQILRETKMPSILVECGFMTNEEEAKLLKSDSYRKKCALAITIAIVELYKLKHKVKVPSTPTTSKTSNEAIYKVQVGAFADIKKAEALAAELKEKGYPAIVT